MSRRLLPESYRTQDGPEGVRADIVVTDLHSGRLIGRTGVVILDALTFGWLVLLLSGIVMYGMGCGRNTNGAKGAGAPSKES